MVRIFLTQEVKTSLLQDLAYYDVSTLTRTIYVYIHLFSGLIMRSPGPRYAESQRCSIVKP